MKKKNKGEIVCYGKEDELKDYPVIKEFKKMGYTVVFKDIGLDDPEFIAEAEREDKKLEKAFMRELKEIRKWINKKSKKILIRC